MRAAFALDNARLYATARQATHERDHALVTSLRRDERARVEHETARSAHAAPFLRGSELRLSFWTTPVAQRWAPLDGFTSR